jgi:hypothetical protein
MRRRRSFLVIVVCMLAMVPETAAACPICFGGADGPLLDAARLGVLAMVGVTVGVLAAFGRWFLALRRLAVENRDAELQHGAPQQGPS